MGKSHQTTDDSVTLANGHYCATVIVSGAAGVAGAHGCGCGCGCDVHARDFGHYDLVHGCDCDIHARPAPCQPQHSPVQPVGLVGVVDPQARAGVVALQDLVAAVGLLPPWRVPHQHCCGCGCDCDWRAVGGQQGRCRQVARQLAHGTHSLCHVCHEGGPLHGTLQYACSG